MPRPNAKKATPKATTDVNNEARRNDAVITVSRIEFGVGQPAARLERVVVDRLRFGVRGERSVDVPASEERRVLRDDDLLV